MASKIGIKAIILAEKGESFQTPPLHSIDIRDNAELLIDESYQSIKDFRNRALRNMVNFKLTAKAYQNQLSIFESLLGEFYYDGFDANIVTVPQTSTSDGDSLLFVGDNYLGYDFEYILSNQERSLKLDLEAAFAYEDAKTIMAGIPGNSSERDNVLFSSSGIYTPFLDSIQFGAAPASLFSKADIVDYNLTLTTEGEKSMYNRTVISYVNAKLEVTARDASISKMSALLSADQDVQLIFKQGAQYGNDETWTFDKGILTNMHEFKIGDQDRYCKMIFEGKVPPSDITVDTSTQNFAVTFAAS